MSLRNFLILVNANLEHKRVSRGEDNTHEYQSNGLIPILFRLGKNTIKEDMQSPVLASPNPTFLNFQSDVFILFLKAILQKSKEYKAKFVFETDEPKLN